MKRIVSAILLVCAMIPAYLVGACSGGHALAGGGGSSTGESSSSSSTGSSSGSCTCSPSPALPAPFTFDDEAPHTVLSINVPPGASMTVRTGIHGHLLAPGNVLATAIAYQTTWGFVNVGGKAISTAEVGNGGWGYVSEAGLGNVTLAFDGPTVNIQVTNATIPAWSASTYVPGWMVTNGGNTYTTPNGGASTIAPTGTGGTGDDGVAWTLVAATTSFTRTWQVTSETIETAPAP